MKQTRNYKRITVILAFTTLVVLSLSSCEKESEPEYSPALQPEQMQFPDPVLGDFHWEADVNGYWVLDSMMERYTNTEGRTIQRRKFPKNTGASLGFVTINNSNFEWLVDDKSSKGVLAYDSTGIGFQSIYDDRLAVILNLSETKLAFCYNLSDYTSDANSREMYFFTRK